jgi:WD40 repeat protein
MLVQAKESACMCAALVRLVPALGLALVLFGATHGAAPPLTDAARVDACGDPLPADALARFGTARFRDNGNLSDSALSPDGKLLAVAGSNEIRFLDTASGKVVRRINGTTGMFQFGRVVFSANGKFLALSASNSIIVCDVAKAEILNEFQPSSQPGHCPVSFSRDGKLIVVEKAGSRDRISVPIWDVIGKKEKKKIHIGFTWEASAILSPDGKMLATWGCRNGETDECTLQLWDTDTGEERLTLMLDRIEQVVFSPDGKQMVLLGSPTSIRDVATGKVFHELPTSWSTFRIAYSPDGKRLVTAMRNGIVQIWDTGSGRRLGQCAGPPSTTVASFAFLPGDKVLAAGYSHDTLRLWDVPSGREHTRSIGHLAAVKALAFSPGGKTLVSAGNDGVRFHALANGKEVRWIEPPNEREERGRGARSASCACLSPDGRYCAWNEVAKYRLRVTDLSSGKPVADLPHRTYYPIAAAFAPDGARLVSLGEDTLGKAAQMVAQVWDPASGLRIGKQIAVTGHFPSLALSPSGKVLAIGRRYLLETEVDNPILLWDLVTGKERTRLPIRIAKAMTFCPDGSLLATRQEGATSLWNTHDGRQVLRLAGARGYDPWPVAFSSDGRLLAVACHGRDDVTDVIRLYELSSGKVRAKYPSPGQGTLALDFSRDGRTLASGGDDTTVMLWDLTGVTGLGRLRKRKPTVNEVLDLWADLGNADAGKAHKAMARLVSAPAIALTLFRKELQPASGPRMPETLRERRAVEILERLATPEARRLLQALANGNPAAGLTSDAANSLKRLAP